MKIYKDELVIAEKILENTSIAYVVDIEPLTEKNTDSVVLGEVFDKTPNTPDLFFVKSILVTTNKNKNDDVFLPAEVWKAKATPVDKMWNVNHDHNKIIGHITSTWAVDSDHNKLGDLEISELPELFHLISAGVIYAKWSDETLQEEADTLIAEITEGNWKTSMEAHFSDFSFAAYKDGEVKYIERTEKTAFLTSKLRCYGGDGKHDGYTLGRALKNITFSGNSLVRNPANPDSVILGEINPESPKKAEKTGDFSKKPKTGGKSGVYLSADLNQEKQMTDILEKQVAELKDQIKSLASDNKGLAKELASANTEKLQQEIVELKDELVQSKKDKDEKDKKKKEMADASDILTKELEDITVKFDKVSSELGEVKTAAKTSIRIQKLVESGLSKEDASTKAESLIGLSDEQFDAVSGALSLLKPVDTEKTDAEINAEKLAKEEAEVEAKKLADEKADDAKADSTETTEEEEGADLTASETDELAELATAFAEHYEDKLYSKENN